MPGSAAAGLCRPARPAGWSDGLRPARPRPSRHGNATSPSSRPPAGDHGPLEMGWQDRPMVGKMRPHPMSRAPAPPAARGWPATARAARKFPGSVSDGHRPHVDAGEGPRALAWHSLQPLHLPCDDTATQQQPAAHINHPLGISCQNPPMVGEKALCPGMQAGLFHHPWEDGGHSLRNRGKESWPLAKKPAPSEPGGSCGRPLAMAAVAIAEVPCRERLDRAQRGPRYGPDGWGYVRCQGEPPTRHRNGGRELKVVRCCAMQVKFETFP